MKGLSLARRVSIFSGFLLVCAIPLGTLTVKSGQANFDSFSIAQAANPSPIEKQAQQIVEWLGTKQYAKALAALSPQLQPLWSAEKLQRVWESQVTDVTGPYKRVVKTKVIDAINVNLVVVTTEFEKKTDDVVITFSPSGEVIATNFPESRSIEQIADSFVEALAKKDYASARGYLHPLLKAEVFPTKVQGAWENFLKRTGAFERIVDTQVREGSDSDGVDIVLVTIRFEKLTDNLILVFDDQKRIVNIDFPLDD